jgi:hypothetical protein
MHNILYITSKPFGQLKAQDELLYFQMYIKLTWNPFAPWPRFVVINPGPDTL